MGILVGSFTLFKCDEEGCDRKSIPYYDQTKALEHAYKVGWFKNESTGKVMCPKCRWNKK